MPGPAIFLLHINDLPDDAVCNIAVYAVGTTFYCKRDQVSDWWQQLELILNLNLICTMDSCKKWFVHFKARTCHLVLIHSSNGSVTIHVKIGGSASDEKSSCKMQSLSFCC